MRGKSRAKKHTSQTQILLETNSLQEWNKVISKRYATRYFFEIVLYFDWKIHTYLLYYYRFRYIYIKSIISRERDSDMTYFRHWNCHLIISGVLLKMKILSHFLEIKKIVVWIFISRILHSESCRHGQLGHPYSKTMAIYPARSISNIIFCWV